MVGDDFGVGASGVIVGQCFAVAVVEDAFEFADTDGGELEWGCPLSLASAAVDFLLPRLADEFRVEFDVAQADHAGLYYRNVQVFQH